MVSLVRNSKYLVILVCVTTLVVTACSAPDRNILYQKQDSSSVWPPAPNKAKIKHIGNIYDQNDLGISKGFLDMLSDMALGKEENHLVLPIAVVENGHGQFLVSDPGVKAIHRFDLHEGRYKLIKLKGGKDFQSPVGLAADSEGNVYIADSELAKIYIVYKGDDEAQELPLNENFIRPTGIAVDRNTGWIYIVDTAAHAISVFDHDRSLIRRIGHRGEGEGEFNYPTYIWKEKNGGLLVADSLNFRIQRFDKHGQYIAKFGYPGTAMGDLSRPKGVAEDSYGHIYVVDSLFHNIQLFDSSGSLLMHFGVQGAGPGEFWLPVGIYISDDNFIYVCDSYNKRVQIFQYIGNGQ